MDQESSRSSSTPSPASSGRLSKKVSLSLDLSAIPPLTQPTPPSNTLIITNLQSADIFRPDNLQTIRELVSKTAPIHAWSPLKSLKRIVVSFFDEQAAVAVRSVWDGEAIMGDRCRVYFGVPTPISTQSSRLNLPDAGKLFFISPPPSPPHGWEVKMEDAPNKMVHAEDLAEALAKLRHNPSTFPALAADASPISPADSKMEGGFASRQRSRSSTLIFQPQAEDDLPCVTVDDMTDEPLQMSPLPISPEPRPIMAHTARPPVELMHDA